MASVVQVAAPGTIQRVRKIQTITIAWMVAEAAVSLFSAWRARSPALLAFGGDSAVELLSAVVCSRYAVARKGETQTLSVYGQCRAQSRCRGISHLCLPFSDCLAGSRNQQHLAFSVGGSNRGPSDSAAHRPGGSRSHARQGLRLLLVRESCAKLGCN